MNGGVVRLGNTALILAFLLLALTGCSSPTEAVPCETRWSDVAWAAIGPDSAEVRAIVQTSDAVFVATGQDGVLAWSAGNGGWEERGLVGRDLTELVQAGPPERLLAGVRVQWQNGVPPDTALLATDDGGTTWHTSAYGFPDQDYQDPDFVTSLVVDTIGRQLAFVGARAGLLRSTDAGGTWSALWDQAVPRVLSYTPAADGVVLAAYTSGNGDAHLARSADGGATWDTVGVWPPGMLGMPLAFAVDQTDPNVIWMGAGGGPALRRSSDAGESWDSLAAFPDRIPVGLQAAGDAIVGVYTSIGGPTSVQVSCDGALTWNAFPGPAGMGQARSVANGEDGSLLVGTAASGVWRVEPAGG